MSTWSPLDLLPGLYVALLGALLCRALARWYDPVPKAVLAALAVPVVVLLWPVLFGGQVLLPGDNLRGHVPFQLLAPLEPHGNFLQGDLIELVTPSLAAARRDIAAGSWPLWNPRAGAGMPLLADPQAQALQPLALLGLPLPLPRAAGATAALRILLALVFTWLLLRRQGMGAGPALAGAYAFGLSGFLLLWLGWPMANSAALLPLCLYAVHRCCAAEGTRQDAVLLAVAAFSLLLGGHPETIAYAAALGLAFLAARTLALPPAERPRALRRAGLALAVATVTAAPALLPALTWLPRTQRAQSLRAMPQLLAAAGAQPVAPGDLARRWLPVVAPNAYGNSRFDSYWGCSNTNEDAGGFTGTATGLAALLGLLAWPLRRRRLPQEGLLLACAAVCLGLLAHPAPLVALASGHGPLLAFLGSRRELLLLAFSLAYLGACTLERCRRGELPRLAVAAAALALGGLIAWAYLAHSYPADPQRLAILRFGWLRWHVRFLVASTLLLAATPRRYLHPATFAVAALVAAELVLAHRPANPPAPPRLAYPVVPPIGFLAAHQGLFRLAALGRDLPPNLAGWYGLSDVRIYNPSAPADYVQAISPIIASWWGEIPELGDPAHPLYRLLAVRHMLTASGRRLPPPWRLVLADPAGWVYEQPGVLPRLFVTATGEPERAGPGAGGEPIQAIFHLEDTRISAVAATSSGGLLASSLYQDGSWRLLAGGQRQEEGFARGPFIAGRLPPGRLRLELLYRPLSFLAGCLLAALALAGGAAAWVPPPSGGPAPRPGPVPRMAPSARFP